MQNLLEKESPLVVRLPRQPGRKENRFAHLLSGEPDIQEEEGQLQEPARLKVAAENERIAELEAEVTELREKLAELQQQFQEFKSQFE